MHILEILSNIFSLDRGVFWAVFLPVLMATQVGMSIWLIGVELFRSMLDAKKVQHNVYHLSSSVSIAAAIAILVSLPLSLSLWMIPLGYCLLSSRYVAQFRYSPADASECIQVQDSSGYARYCDICNIFQHDRIYHDYATSEWIPLMDHFCPWWSGTVWRNNKKAYLLFLLALPVQLAICLGVTIWVMINPRYELRNPRIGFILIDGFFILLALWLAFVFTLSIAFWNVSSAEYAAKTIWYRLRSGTIKEWRITSYNAAESPWYMGWRENFRLAMGHKRDLLFFWKPTPMETAASLPNCLLTGSSPQQIELQHRFPRSRRSAVQSSSTGFEAESNTWGAVLRRRHSSDYV